MKVLIVASYNSNHFSPFVLEQANALSEQGIEIDYFGIIGHGMIGYYSNIKRFFKLVKEYKPDVVHAHYGLSGLLANLQRTVPVVTTYHGSDIHSSKRILFLSRIAMCLSKHNIFVGENLYEIAKYKKENYSILSCGINMSVARSIDFLSARKQLGWDSEKIYVLFAGAFNNQIKNYSLARASVDLVGNCELIELKGYSKEEVYLLMNACNLLLTTSLRESGPLVVKEAMACNRPVVSTDVGDVRCVIGNTEGCYITSYDVNDCADQIKKAIEFSRERGDTNGRKRIVEIGLDNEIISKRLITIYDSILNDILTNGKC